MNGKLKSSDFDFIQFKDLLFLRRETSTLSLTNMEILLMCSLLCATDVIAAVSMLNPKNQPKLFSMVFGEGIINDAVCIILFNTVNKFA